jgi:hypothetical protein
MRSPLALVAVPLLALAAAACSSDGNDAVNTSVDSSTVDTGTSPDSSTDSTTDGSSADTVAGPALDQVVRGALDRGTVRYSLYADPAGVESMMNDLPGTSSSESSSTSSSTESTVGGSSDSTATGTGEGCDLAATDRLQAVADTQSGLRCVALPDGTRLIVDDHTIYLQQGDVWTQTVVQFDAALAQLDAQQLAALHDPAAVLNALAATSDAEGPMQADDGLEYRVILQIADVDDPFLVAIAQRAGASTVTVHVFTDDSGTEIRGMAYEFVAAADTPGAANGDGTGGTTTVADSSSPSVNGQGGGNGSTTSVAASLPDSGSSTLPPDGTFEDVPAVLVVLEPSGDTTPVVTPTEADNLNLGDLGASFEVDLSSGQG